MPKFHVPFGIELIDHIINTEKEHISMTKIQKISKDYDFSFIQTMSKVFCLNKMKNLCRKAMN